MKKSKNKNKNVVYNIIFGDWDELNEPAIVTPGWDYVCFTDTDKKSDVWEIRKVEKDPSLSDRRNSRKIEILYHHYLGEYETTIKVPGYAVLNIDLNEIADLLGDSYDMVLLNHPRRKCTYDEFQYYIDVSGDPEGVLAKQMERYKKEGMPVRLGLVACGMVVRKIGNKNVEKFCELWWDEVLNYSSNDQHSFMYIYWKYGLIKYRKWGFRYFNKFIRCGKHHAVNKEYVYKHLLD